MVGILFASLQQPLRPCDAALLGPHQPQAGGGGGHIDQGQEPWGEATCPICLEYFREPVTLPCGHNFCQACISQCWEGSDTDISCPQCRETVKPGNLRPNRQLANVLEIAKRLSV
uniref:RING-type domain-containing protein n=1 Tax=Pelusios castaneus TaxID=367368 RepID=A0A8C8SBL6_9SAUR